jgi:HIRAN domain-containing protein
MTDTNDTNLVRCPIVGSKFYPPAMEILLLLPVGTALRAVAEPTNPHDPNAIQVWIDHDSIPERARGLIARNIHRPLNQPAYQLGHIAATFAASLKKLGFPDDGNFTGILAIGRDGGNRIVLPSSFIDV